MANVQDKTRVVFTSKKNEEMLGRLLVSDFNRRIGGELNPQQKVALDKRIKYYIQKVNNDSDLANYPVQELNTAVLQAVVPDYTSYLNRPSRPNTEAEMDNIRNDVSTRFDSMQKQRQGERSIPDAPTFQLTNDDNYPPTRTRLEELKKQREDEATRFDSTAAPSQVVQNEMSRKQGANDIDLRIRSDDLFKESSREFAANDMNALAVRESDRVRNNNQSNQIIDVPPDPRRAFFGENEAAIFGARNQGTATANPTIIPQNITTRAPLPQDIIKAQDSVIAYKDTEYNLFLYSADRDWGTNTSENRYNFSVNFDPANNRIGFGLSPSTYIKFKNIVRIELVKVIMPTEGIDIIATKSSTSAYNTSGNINVFSYPYLQVHINELNTNGFGTNDGINNAFGVVSYDAYWASDSGLKNRGFTRLVPKFLKCQKVYYPTPLSTLQKMTIQIQKPDGTLVSSAADALDVSGIVTSAQLGTGGPPPTTRVAWEPAGVSVDVADTFYYDTTGEYLWVQTTNWFSQFVVTQGDRINFKNVALPTTFTATGPASVDFLNFINRPEGHIVVDIAQMYLASTTLFFKTGSNKVGYSNFIIIRNNFNSPTTGSTTVVNYGGTSTLNTAFLAALVATPRLSAGRLLNMSHQVQLIFRVITRDMDSATRLRPDNL
jgi:hypothetical protein